jgi:hypothetical protein
MLGVLIQAVPVTPTQILAGAFSAAENIVSLEQVTYVVVAAVFVSFGIWTVRRGLKLGR